MKKNEMLTQGFKSKFNFSPSFSKNIMEIKKRLSQILKDWIKLISDFFKLSFSTIIFFTFLIYSSFLISLSLAFTIFTIIGICFYLPFFWFAGLFMKNKSKE